MDPDQSHNVVARPRFAMARAPHGKSPVFVLLAPQDRELLTLWINSTIGVRALAGLLHCHHGTLTRRLRRLRQQLFDPLMLTIAEHLGELSPDYRAVAVRALIRREPLNTLARELGYSPRQLDRVAAEVRGWALALLQTKRNAA